MRQAAKPSGQGLSWPHAQEHARRDKAEGRTTRCEIDQKRDARNIKPAVAKKAAKSEDGHQEDPARQIDEADETTKRPALSKPQEGRKDEGHDGRDEVPVRVQTQAPRHKRADHQNGRQNNGPRSIAGFAHGDLP